MGDKVIILSYSAVTEEEAKYLKPKLIYVNERNAIESVNEEALLR